MEFTIAITTRNRPDSFKRTYEACKKYTDNIIVVDDASYTPYANGFRFENRVGIPKAKNKCILEFMKTKSQHLFMLDDDCFPIHEDSFSRYLESDIKHLCYTFLQHSKVEDNLKIHTLGNGCMMYFHRACFDLIGGFDTAFGLGKYEHPDISRRIHNIGLTKHKFADVLNSHELWYCLDQNNAIERSFTADEMTELLLENHKYFLEQKNSIEYKSYESK